MVRRLKGFLLVLACCPIGACLGGQTGEPTSGDCTTSAVRWQQAIDGVSPEQLALAYQGEHRVNLHWSKDPAAITQSVTLTLNYPQQSATTNDCHGPLSVSVNFSLQADDGTLIESANGSLSAERGTLQPATLSGSGQHFRIAAKFSQAASKVLVSGTLGPLANAMAPVSANFSSDSEGFAGAGGI